VTPLVSIVTPCYRQGQFLPDAIESVLAQSMTDLEMIVVDDGSPDDTSRVAQSYSARDPRVRCVAQSNRGLARARNAGLERAGGTFVVFLDADDRLHPDALSDGIASLEQHPRAVYTRGRFDVIDAQGRVIDQIADDGSRWTDEYELLLRDNPIWLPAAVMFRRAIFESNAPFDSHVDAAADLELYLRLARLYPVTSHASVVAQYRRHAHNMSMNPMVMAPAMLGVLEAQRRYVGSNGRWRAAQRYAMREWELSHLIPMMRRALRDFLRGDGHSMIAGLPLIVARGPGAVARASLRRLRRDSRNGRSEMETMSSVA
jgi:glycosyltransferase involved in cell wall biosynthesis